ncbi:hypothetical protein DH2020_010912 [Rehmannia glutinosa]|uniref:Two-component response regulator-like protein n=1 Tax=Rehmannia glutinosa TaxID=99300 RepID=A0ABR0XBX0_REHGL
MATTANATLVKCAIEDGAFLFMEKPTAPHELKYLWQHILREITRKKKEKGKCVETSTKNKHNRNFYPSRGENMEGDKTTEGVTVNRYVSTNKVTCQKGRREIINFSAENNVPSQCMRPKMCTEWTPELHEKFMAAVKQLGDGSLTRMQVASHLQKCRHGWQPPHERQGRRPKGSKSSDSSNSHQSRPKKYGIFPRLIRGSQPQFPGHDHDNQYIEQGLIIATSDDMGNSTPINSNGTHNNIMEQQGTWDTTLRQKIVQIADFR